ncbi:unnamed protein product [Protopolystoma xenopodis]|uniref:Uncharacterized protein n=1 Tax=Protopolystoma xenopodis TaxID=117903 RepID=A0A448WKS7_9PLAT|nr:unnamed protein product [Protopolystoma xenopodis]
MSHTATRDEEKCCPDTLTVREHTAPLVVMPPREHIRLLTMIPAGLSCQPPARALHHEAELSGLHDFGLWTAYK